MGLVNSFPQGRCGESDARACFSVEQYLDLLFNQSDTSLMILTAISDPGAGHPLDWNAMRTARTLAERVCGDGRCCLHGGVQPTNGPAGQQIDGMAALRATTESSAGSVHPCGRATVGGSTTTRPMRRRSVSRSLPVSRTWVEHRVCSQGVSGGSEYASPFDVGPAAKAHPTFDSSCTTRDSKRQ